MANKQKNRQVVIGRRAARTRFNIFGTAERPRMTVHRTLKHIYVQLVDDSAGKTLVAVKDVDVKGKGKPVEVAKAVGKMAAEKAVKLGITSVVFDRGAFQYHGRVKAVADGAREGGLKF